MDLLPKKMSRKEKKKYRKRNTYAVLGIYPFSFNKMRRLNNRYPKRGDWVKNKLGFVGQFVGVEPAGRVWIAYRHYRNQFPYKLQCKIFDLCFKATTHKENAC